MTARRLAHYNQLVNLSVIFTLAGWAWTRHTGWLIAVVVLTQLAGLIAFGLARRLEDA